MTVDLCINAGNTHMLADMLGRGLAVAAQPEAGALGPAIAAAVGAGRFADLDEAAAAMVAPAHHVTPDPGRQATYQRRYQLWHAIEKSLAPHWATLRQFGDA